MANDTPDTRNWLLALLWNAKTLTFVYQVDIWTFYPRITHNFIINSILNDKISDLLKS